MTDLRLVAPAAVAWVAAALVVGVPAAALWVAIGSFLVAALVLVLRHPTLAVCAIGAALVCTVVAVQGVQQCWTRQRHEHRMPGPPIEDRLPQRAVRCEHALDHLDGQARQVHQGDEGRGLGDRREPGSQRVRHAAAPVLGDDSGDPGVVGQRSVGGGAEHDDDARAAGREQGCARALEPPGHEHLRPAEPRSGTGGEHDSANLHG